MNLHTILQEMRPIIYQAGRIALSHFTKVKAEYKEDKSFVTQADREVETFLRREITERYPDHGILGEEEGQSRMENTDCLWALDPIDGTAPFLYEMPVWAISVGLISKEKPLLGFVYLPVLDELYWAIDGGKAYLNDRVIQVSEPKNMTRGSCILAPSLTNTLYESHYQGRVFGFGSAASHLCMIARGNVHGAILDRVKLWDIAGGAMILKAAGGTMSYLSGKKVDLWALRNGQRIPETLLIGNQENVEQLRPMFTEKPYDDSPQRHGE